MKMFLAGITILLLTAYASPVLAFAQNNSITASAPDPQITAALHAVSAQRIQQTIEKLVSFQTRHTLSSDVPASTGKGINAAAEWIKSEFESYSKACGGCLEVKTDEFVQEPGNRIPQPTKLTNVYAVLRGSDPANAGRIVLVTGHYDSRNSETNDAVGASPGANDDASGTAVSMECARVLSQYQVSRHHHLSHGRRRGTGPLRQRSLRQDGAGAGLEHRGGAEQRHRWWRPDSR